jgi:ankyrin repeat protein
MSSPDQSPPQTEKQYKDVDDFTGYDSDDDSEEKYGELNPLQAAAKEGKLDEVKEIVAEKKIDLNENNFCRYNAVTLAAEFKHWDIVTYLVENKADLNNYTTTAFHISPLYWAVAHEDPDMVKYLLLNGARVNEVYSANHEHLLHCTIRTSNNQEILKTLLDAKAVPSPQLPSGRKDTPLSLAILDGKLNTVKLLQHHGAKLPHHDDPESIIQGLYGFIEVSQSPKDSFKAAFEMRNEDGSVVYGAESVALGLYGCLRSRKQTGEYIKMLLDYDAEHNLDAVNTPIKRTSPWISMLVGFDEDKLQKVMAGAVGEGSDAEKAFTPYELAVIKNKPEYIEMIKPFANENNIQNGQAYAESLGY